MSNLNVPIYINGGENEPSALSERELYVNISNGYLYGGLKNSSVAKLKVGHSDTTDKISNSWLNIDVSDTGVFEVGDLKYDRTNKQFTSDTTYVLNNSSVTNLKKLVLDSKSNLYGSTLPTTGVEGQVFFKLG